MPISYCCLVDNSPRFMIESMVWLNCLKRQVGPSDQLIMGFLNGHPTDMVEYVESQGAKTFFADTLLPESPHCNKIIPLLEGLHRETDHLVITDTDVYIVDDISAYPSDTHLRLPPNNHCNPPLDIFENLFDAAGFPTPLREGVSLFPSEISGQRDSYINNVSGGVLMCPRQLGDWLGERWLHWARWLLENRALMGRWKIHVDQVAIALATEELGRDIHFLPPQLNAVLELLDHVSRVRCFHLTPAHIPRFANRFRENKTLDSSGLDGDMKDCVERLNTGIRESVEAANELPSVRSFLPNFHNPRWNRTKDELS